MASILLIAKWVLESLAYTTANFQSTFLLELQNKNTNAMTFNGNHGNGVVGGNGATH